MALSSTLTARIGLPLIAAPMTGVSSLELILACCRNGVIGAFPTHMAATIDELDRWLVQIEELDDQRGIAMAPAAPNLVVHPSNPRLELDVACLIRHGAEIVITSVGSPKPVLGPLQDAGCAVFADVATLRHVDRALQLGVDGLVLLTAGAGGQTGWINPFAFVRAVRERFDGPIVLAGGIGDGTALFCAQILGADLAYMGTKFIATDESAASPAYKQAIVDATLDDVETTLVKTGLPANFLRNWLQAEGLMGPSATPPEEGFDFSMLVAIHDEWAAGHSVSGVRQVLGVRELIARTRAEYEAAQGILDATRSV